MSNITPITAAKKEKKLMAGAIATAYNNQGLAAAAQEALNLGQSSLDLLKEPFAREIKEYTEPLFEVLEHLRSGNLQKAGEVFTTLREEYPERNYVTGIFGKAEAALIHGIDESNASKKVKTTQKTSKMRRMSMVG